MTLHPPIQDVRFSTRLLRKGALIEETYRAFQSWDLSASVRQNLQRLRETNLIGADNQAWLGEVAKTPSTRFHSEAEVRPLVALARKDLPLQEWKFFLLWHIGQTDALYYRFPSPSASLSPSTARVCPPPRSPRPKKFPAWPR